eukprot:SAG11_NODE_2501_length_3281_cov_1.563168_2_plen_251_part_00
MEDATKAVEEQLYDLPATNAPASITKRRRTSAEERISLRRAAVAHLINADHTTSFSVSPPPSTVENRWLETPHTPHAHPAVAAEEEHVNSACAMTKDAGPARDDRRPGTNTDLPPEKLASLALAAADNAKTSGDGPSTASAVALKQTMDGAAARAEAASGSGAVAATSGAFQPQDNAASAADEDNAAGEDTTDSAADAETAAGRTRMITRIAAEEAKAPFRCGNAPTACSQAIIQTQCKDSTQGEALGHA